MMISKYFKRSEFKCKCKSCGFDAVDVELIAILDKLREHFDTPVKINSACRCTTHNHLVGGTPKSQHLYGKACDIVVKDVTAERAYHYLNDLYPNSKGLGIYDNFVHVDVRDNKARWDKTTSQV